MSLVIAAYLEERRRALLSGDPSVKRVGVPLLDDPSMLQRLVDKALTADPDVPPDVRRDAAARLRAVGWSPMADDVSGPS